MSALIQVEGLHKVYRQGFWMKRVEAVRGISFSVAAGEIFGFLGPNGAGKTTTIKILTGLSQPTRGTARLFGQDVREAAARKRLGFLPENPYIYPYLTAREFVHLSARLSGLSPRAARSRTQEVLSRVGIAYAADRSARTLSKGMLQRAGLAAALVGDPELLVLDEPMSGLDPVGRKEVRELILDERRGGRTIFFSSHILTDVQALCERVAILRRGRVVVSGPLSELLRTEARRAEVVLSQVSEALRTRLTQTSPTGDRPAADGFECVQEGQNLRIRVEGQAAVQQLVAHAMAAGALVEEVSRGHETLEHLFMREAIHEGESAESS